MYLKFLKFRYKNCIFIKKKLCSSKERVFEVHILELIFQEQKIFSLQSTVLIKGADGSFPLNLRCSVIHFKYLHGGTLIFSQTVFNVIKQFF
jgi:hypothetical protein